MQTEIYSHPLIFDVLNTINKLDQKENRRRDALRNKSFSMAEAARMDLVNTQKRDQYEADRNKLTRILDRMLNPQTT